MAVLFWSLILLLYLTRSFWQGTLTFMLKIPQTLRHRTSSTCLTQLVFGNMLMARLTLMVILWILSSHAVVITSSSVRILPEFPSDHVYCATLIFPRPPPTRKSVKYRKLCSVDMETFTNDITNLSLKNITGSDLNTLIHTLCCLLNKHASLQSRHIMLRPHAPWYTDELRAAEKDLLKQNTYIPTLFTNKCIKRFAKNIIHTLKLPRLNIWKTKLHIYLTEIFVDFCPRELKIFTGCG